MYEPLLFIHSWFRWIVVITGVRLLFLLLRGWITKKEWEAIDTKNVKIFNEVLAYQIAMGIGLYAFLSPLTKIAFSDMKYALKDPILRFWSFEHGTTMILAIAIFEIGRMIAMKKAPIEKRFKILSITMMISISAILMAIPWPFLKHGRNLFRFFF